MPALHARLLDCCTAPVPNTNFTGNCRAEGSMLRSGSRVWQPHGAIVSQRSGTPIKSRACLCGTASLRHKEIKSIYHVWPSPMDKDPFPAAQGAESPRLYVLLQAQQVREVETWRHLGFKNLKH